MAILKCKMCGGTVEFEKGATIGTCDSCGTQQTLPRIDDERRANLYDRANHFRRSNEFEKAADLFEQILNEDGSDAEAYWSLVLCRYGIEYVEDPLSHRRVPTVNRTQFTSIFDDEDYKSALSHADMYQRGIYEQEAREINEIQKGILAISGKEEPYDVFICYKETDDTGKRTYDSVLANDLYHQLTQEGFKVFFARITLEDKLGSAYEPYIFSALNSAKVMVVLGTKPEYFKAVWVKNEWSRYLALVKKSGGKKVLIPAYRDMDPYDLPEEFSHLQAQDMSKLGFMQDLIRGIKKIAKPEEPKTATTETVVVNSGAAAPNTAALLKRAFMFLQDGDWRRANEFCEQVLNYEPENAEAYVGKLMVSLHVKRRKELGDCGRSFAGNPHYIKAITFGNEALKQELDGYLSAIENRATVDKEKSNNEAVALMNGANNKYKFIAAANAFKKLPGYKDADALAAECMRRASEDPTEARIKAFNAERIKVSDQIHGYRNKNILPYIITLGVGGGIAAFSALILLICLLILAGGSSSGSLWFWLVMSLFSVAAGVIASVIGFKRMKEKKQSAEYLEYQKRYNYLNSQIYALRQQAENERRQALTR